MRSEKTVMAPKNNPSISSTSSRHITARLHAAGTSLTAIAATLGITQQAISNCLAGRRSERIEREIARRLGEPVQQVFPERYRRDGTRIGRSMPRRTSSAA